MNEYGDFRRYERLKYGLVVDLAERIRTLDRNIIYLYSLVNFLNDYYKTFFHISDDKIDDETIVYSIYSNTLEYIIRDMKVIKKNLGRLCNATFEDLKNFKIIVANKEDSLQDTENPYIEFLKEIKFCGYFDEENKKYRSKIFEDFQRIKISNQYKDGIINPSSVDELLMNMRHMISIDTHEPLRITLGSIFRAVNALTCSINQSMGGLFIGNIIEQEPSVYTHKDLFMIMNMISFLCRGYHEFLRNLFRNSKVFNDNNDKKLSDEAVKLFYCITGILINLKDDLKNNEGNNGNKRDLSYTIAFGTSPLPELMERYKLILLPITCAYRPRYWGILAHEVSHSYIQGLCYFEEILDEVSIYEVVKSKEKARKLLKKLREYPNDENKSSSYVNYIYHLIKHSSELLEDYEIRSILNLDTKPTETDYFKIKLAQVSEIVADILGFLMSGYAYIPALASNILTLPQTEIPYSEVIPHIFRMGVVIGVAEELSNDDEIIDKILENIIDEIKNFREFDEFLSGKSDKEKRDEIKQKILDFLNAFEYMINNNIVLDYDFTSGYYLYMLGRNLGEVLYERDIKPLIKAILEPTNDNIKNFGWFKISKNDKDNKDNDKHKYYVLANIYLNCVVIERITKIIKKCEKKEDLENLDLNKLTCYSPETRKIFKKFREIWRGYRNEK